MMASMQDKKELDDQVLTVKDANAGLTTDLDATRSKLKRTKAQESALQQQCEELQSEIDKQAREAEALHTSWTKCAIIREQALQASAFLSEHWSHL